MNQVDFNGQFRLSPKMSPVPGDWYLGFECQSCGEGFAVLDDPDASGGTKVTGTATFDTTCPGCGAERSYEASALRSFQAASARPAAPMTI